MSKNDLKNIDKKNSYDLEGEIEDISDGAIILNNIVKKKILELANKIKESNQKGFNKE